jgi:prepilin-type N-terminal cleavage/methylation domain-containing protein
MSQLRRKSPTSRRRAFTLIEAIAAIVILSVAMPGMFWALRDATVRRYDPVQMAKARWLAQEKLEDIVADRHSTSRGYSYVLTAAYAAEKPVSGFAGFTRSVAVSETGANFAVGTGWKTVTVTVTYNDGRNVSRSVALSTIVTSYTP